MSTKKIEGRVRLAIDFPSPEAMVAWVEEVRSHGGFGTVDVPWLAGEWPEEHRPQQARADVGIRALDSLDAAKIGPDNSFIVSGLRDGGKYLALDTVESTAAVVTTNGGAV